MKKANQTLEQVAISWTQGGVVGISFIGTKALSLSQVPHGNCSVYSLNSMDKDKEIKILKGAVKALAKMVLHYRIGKTQMPEWVFDNIDKAKAIYGDDLTKI